MKLTPQSMALWRAASDSESSTGPQALPMAHAPKPISETFQGVRPNDRYFMDSLLMMLSDFHRGDAETQRKTEGPESHSPLVPRATRAGIEMLVSLSVFSAPQRLCGEALLFRIFSRHLQGHGGHRQRRQRDFDAA